MNTRQIIVIFCLFAVFFSALSIASASHNVDNITVSVANDQNTLDVANDNDEILQEPQGTFTELDDKIQHDTSGNISLDRDYISNGGDTIDISKDITIDGGDYTLNANGKSSIFNIVNNSHVILKNIVFTNAVGEDGSAVKVNPGSSVEIIDCKFINNNATNLGGAIYIVADDSSKVSKITNSIFENNKALNGGAVYLHSDKAAIEGSTFSANYADNDGAAVYVAGDNCNLANSTFANNVAGDDGPAVYWQGSNGIIYNISCSGNRGISGIDPRDGSRSSSKGGTICLTGSNVTISKSTFTDSYCGYEGGALFITGNGDNVIECIFDNCTSIDTNGGALYIIGNNTNVLDCDFKKCNANLSGGVIYVEGNYITIDNSNFTENGAHLDGAALFIEGDYCILSNSTFTANIAGDDGGAIYWEGDHGLLYNVTCINNKGISDIDPIDKTRSNSKGGTICLTGSNVTIDKSTFKQSSAKVDGGALFITGNNVNVLNSNFEDCTSTGGSGGALYIIGNYTNVSDCTFDNCKVPNYDNHRGGAIFVEGNNATIEKSLFNHTQALIGGAIYIAGDDTTVDDSVFAYSDASGPTLAIGGTGGAISVDGEGTVISNSDFTHSTAVNYGGAIAIWGPNTLITNNNFDDSITSLYNGGAIFVNGENTTISSSNFTKGRATGDQFARGGAIDVQGDNSKILDCNFDDCQAHFGGVIHVSGINALIDGSNINNSKAYEGGAIYVDGTYTTISNSNITHSTADNYGGAIYVAGDNAEIINTNIADSNVKNYYGGAIFISGENTHIDKSNFTSCSALSKSSRGGAIDIEGANAVIKDSNFDDCHAIQGGAIYAYGNSAQIIGSTFNSSDAKNGGAIYLTSWGALVDKSNITNCIATENGGGIYVAEGSIQISESNFNDCIARGTSASNGGGAIYINGPDTHISSSNFSSNKVPGASARGGSIFIKGERTIIDGSEFVGSSANQGGEIFIEGGNAVIDSSKFINSSSRSSGGSIYVKGDETTIRTSSFDNISAKNDGGAIFVKGARTDILGSSFYNCTVGTNNKGGAIYIDDIGTTVAYSNFTLSKSGIGGAIYINGKNTTISYCNLHNNYANSAGAIKVYGDDTIISNSNFTYNYALTQSGGALDIGGSNASVYYSWFDHNNATLDGGAINWLGGHGDDSIIGSTFTNNIAYDTSKGGGAIYWTAATGKDIGSGGLIQDSIFINNTAAGRHGGALDWFQTRDSKINNCLFINNTAKCDGGALYTGDQGGKSYNLNMSNCQFYNNTAGLYGGAIANQMANSYVYNNTFDGNKAKAGGGTILMKEGPAKNSVIDHCYIYNSQVGDVNGGYGEGGGAILLGVNGDSNITISNSAIMNSTIAKGPGGAIAIFGSDCSLINVSIEDVSTQNDDGGAIYWKGKNGNLDNVTIFNASSNSINNAKSSNGGAIYVSGWYCNLNDIRIFKSSANNDENCGKTNYGGAVFVTGSYGKLTNVIIDNSSSSNVKMTGAGGAIYWDGYGGTLINATISNTLATGNGGAIYWKGGSPVISNISITYSQTEVINSTNTADGGAIYATSIGELNNVYIRDARAYKNNGDIRGGAIYLKDGKTLNNVTVVGSRASTDDGTSYGGAVYSERSSGSTSVWVYNSTFEENNADLGGGLYFNKVTSRIYDTLFRGNVANRDGGALYGISGDEIIVNSSFEHNSAKKGGAIFSQNVHIQLDDSTLEFNTAEEKGGAIYHNYVDRSGSSWIRNTDILNNTAFQGSAIYATKFNRFSLNNVVLLDNQANSNKFIDKAVGVDENGNNYTSAVFVGFDNLLNSIWQEATYALSCTNVTYWGVDGRTIANAPPVQSDREVNINVTVEMYDENGVQITTAPVVTDANGRLKYVFDAEDGKTYYFAYVHKSDRYYTYLRDTMSNSSLVKIYVYTPIFYAQNQTVLIELTDGAWGNLNGTVTVTFNDTDHTTFTIDVVNGTGVKYNITDLAIGLYNATASYAGDINHTGDTDWVLFEVLPYDDLEITKDVNITADYVNVTDVIKYTITVTNHGPSKAYGVNVTERLSPYLKLQRSKATTGSYNLTGGYWYIGDLDVNDFETLTIIAEIVHMGPITNTVWVTGLGKDTNESNNVASAHNFTAVPIVDLRIYKDVNVTGDVVKVLDVIKFNVTVVNAGPCNATGVIVKELIDSHLEILSNTTTAGKYSEGTWNIGNLANGSSATLTIVAKVVYSGNISNAVHVSGFENETDYTNNDASIRNLTAVANVDLKITKEVNVTTDVIAVHDKIKFTITVTNNGPCNATGVYVGEVLSPHLQIISNETSVGHYDGATWIIGNLNHGEVHNLTIIAEVISAGNISNAVSIVGNDNDTNKSNNNDSIKNITAIDNIDLEINKTVDVTTGVVNVTDVIMFTVSVRNKGPSDATNVSVSEALSPHLKLISYYTWGSTYDVNKGVWYIGNLTNGDWRDLVIVAEVISAGNISNVVVVTGNENDTNKSNNRDEIPNITAKPIVDLRIKKDVNTTSSVINVTDYIKYTITVFNAGPCNATNVNVSEVLSPHLKLIRNETENGYYNVGDGIWYIGTLNNQSTAVLTIYAQVISNGTIANVVIVNSSEEDTDPTNNRDEITNITAVNIVDLQIKKEVNVTSTDIDITEKLKFTITVYNAGPCNATGVYVCEPLSDILVPININPSQGNYDGYTWYVGNLNSGDTATLTIESKIAYAGTVENAVNVTGNEIDTNLSNNKDNITPIRVSAHVDIGVNKTVNVTTGFVNVSDLIEFTVTAYNNGPCNASGVYVLEALDSHLGNYTYVSTPGTTYDGYTWFIGNLNAHTNATLKIVARVIAPGNFSNYVEIFGWGNDTNKSNNNYTIPNITALPIVDLEITKEANVSGIVQYGDKIMFTITVRNNGPCEATNVNVTEVLSSHINLISNQTAKGHYDVGNGVWYIGNMTKDEWCQLVIVANVTSVGNISNVVAVTSTENDTNKSNNKDEIPNITAIPIVDLQIKKEVNVTSNVIYVLDEIKYTITVYNAGPCNATNVNVSEVLSSHLKLIKNETASGYYNVADGIWYIGDLANKSTAVLTITAKVISDGIISNVVIVNSTEKDTNLSNNRAEIKNITAVDVFDLQINKTVNVTTTIVGVTDLIRFNITVYNAGPCNASDVYVFESLSDKLDLISNVTSVGNWDGCIWYIGDLNNGSNATLTIVAKVAYSGIIENAVNVTGNGVDTNISNNKDNITPLIATIMVDLGVNKTVNVTTGVVNVTDLIEFTIFAYNNCSFNASDVYVIEDLDSHLGEYAYVSTPGTTYDGHIWHIGYLDAGANATLKIVARVIAPGNFSNYVEINGSDPDTNPSNDNYTIPNITAYPIVDLAIAKEVNVSNVVYYGDTIRFTITVRNNGPCEATNVNVSEALSSHLNLISNQTTKGHYDVGNGVWYIGNMTKDEWCQLVIVANVTSVGNISNVVVVTSTENDTNKSNNNASIPNITAEPIVDLRINKTVNVTTTDVSVTDVIKFTLTVVNDGPCNATNVYVCEPLSDKLQLISWNATKGEYKDKYTWVIGNLTCGENATLTVVAKIVYSGIIENAVNVTSNDVDIDPSNNKDNITPLIATTKVDLAINKTVNVTTGVVNVSDLVEFTITAYNYGPCNASGVYVLEALDSHLVEYSHVAAPGTTYDGYTWYIGYLDAGANATLTVVARVVEPGNFSNYVEIFGYDFDTNQSNNNATIPNITANPIVDLDITKEVNVDNGVVYVGDSIVFTITVRNNGPCDATNVNVTEVLSPHLKLVDWITWDSYYSVDDGVWYIDTLNKYDWRQLIIVAEVDSVGNISNAVVVTSTENDTNMSNNNASIPNITAKPSVDLQIMKDVNVTSGFVEVYDFIEYTITVYNDGPCDATDVYVNETLSSYLKFIRSDTKFGYYNLTEGIWHIGDLANGSRVNLTIVALVMKNGTVIPNTVIVNCTEKDNNPYNNWDEVYIAALPIVDLRITKEVNVTTDEVGVTDFIKYVVTVYNDGPCNATGIYVIESLSDKLSLISNVTSVGDWDGYTWNIPRLANGTNATLTIVAQVIYPGNISNFVVVYSYQNETNYTNNNATVNLTAVSNVDLVISKEVNVTTGVVNVSDRIKFIITVRNDGPCNATGVYVQEVLNSNLKLISNATSVGHYDGATWNIGNLTNKASANLTIIAEVISAGNITNVVNVTCYENDTNKSNDEANITNITSLPIVDLRINKTVEVSTVYVNDFVYYTINLINLGPCKATDVNVTENLSPLVKFVNARTWIGTYDNATNIWHIPELEVKVPVSLVLTLQVIANGTIENVVTVSSHENDTNTSNNNASSDNVTALPVVDLKVNKTVNVTVVNVTDMVKYTICVVNIGPCNATGVNVTDKLDSKLEFVSFDASRGGITYDAKSGVAVIGNLNVNETVGLIIVARVVEMGIIPNVVNVTSTEKDTNGSNNENKSDDVIALPIVDLKITKVVNVTTGVVNVSDRIKFTITVVNNGPCNATGVYVSEILNSNLKLVSNETSVGHYDGATWNIGNLTNQSSANLTIIAEVISVGNITNVVNVTSFENDTNESNNEANITNITSLPVVDLRINKTVEVKTVYVNDLVYYTIDLINLGPCKATDVNVTEYLSPLVKFVNARTWIGTYDNATNVWNIPELDVNVTVSLVLTLQVIANGTIENVVTVSSHENDTNTSNNNASSDNVTALPVVDLKVNKTVNVTVVNVTDMVKYTICVVNIGPCNATGVNVTDKLDSKLEFVSFDASRSGITYDAKSGVAVIGNLDVNETVELIIVARVVEMGIIPNVVNVTSTEKETNESSNKNKSDEVIALPIVDLKITKVVNVTTGVVNVSDRIKFTITVVNNGPCNATGVYVSEILNSNLKLISNETSVGHYDGATWNIGNLTNQSSANLTIIAEVVSVGNITNVVNVTSFENDTNESNNEANITNITSLPVVDLRINKTVEVKTVHVNDLVYYTIDLINLGPSKATDVNVTEYLSPLVKFVNARTWIGTYNNVTNVWNIPELDVNVTVSLVLTVQVIGNGTIENVVTVSSHENDTNTSNNNASSDNVTALPVVDLKVNKTVNITVVNVTDMVKYTICVVNIGPCNATGVNVTDKLNSKLEFVSFDASRRGITYDAKSGVAVIGNLDVNETVELIIVARVVEMGIVPNVVNVTSTEKETNESSNKNKSDDVVALPIVDLKITKVVNVTNGIVNVSDWIKFTITVVNNGPCNATGVYVSEILNSNLKLISNETSVGHYDGATWIIGNLTNQSSANLTIIAEVVSVGNITNIVNVTSFENDTNESNNEANITNITSLPVVDLRIYKTVEVKSVYVNDFVYYAINLINLGPCKATDVNVTENLSPLVKFVNARTWIGTYDNATNVWHIPELEVNVPVSLVLTVQVIGNGTIENIVTVSSHENDTNKSNNNASSDNVTALPVVDLKINKTVNVTVVNVTDIVKYTICVVNIGPCNATGVNLTDKLDSKLEFVSFDASRGGITYDAKSGVAVIGNLDVNETVELIIVARVAEMGIIPNTVNVTSTEKDNDESDNKNKSDDVIALPIVDLKITKEANISGVVNVSDLIKFTITVVNNGPCNATGVYVSEILNSNLKLISNETSVGHYDGATWVIGNLTNQSTATLTIIAEVVSAGNITNIVNVTSFENDTNKSNNEANITNITSLPVVDLRINKTVNVLKVNVGDYLDYTIDVINAGPSKATCVNVTEYLSPFVKFVNARTWIGTYDNATNIWNIPELDVNVTVSLVLTVQVTSNGTIENVVSVNSNENDTNKSNNNASSDNVTALPIVDIMVNKTVNVTVVNVTDLVEFTIVVKNNGPSNASDVGIVDKLDSKLEFVSFDSSRAGVVYNVSTGIAVIGNLNANETVVLNIVACVIERGEIPNTVIATSRENDSNISNNHGESENITSLPVVDLKVIKDVNVTLVNVSDLVEYTITVVNNGPSNASGVNVTDKLSNMLEFVSFDATRTDITYDSLSGTAAVGNLNVNETVVLTIIAKVLTNGTVSNIASVTSNENDTNKSNNNGSSHNVTALPVVDVKINKTVSVTEAGIGEEFTYVITVVNNGPSNATNVNVREKLSDYVVLIEYNASKGNYDINNCNWYIGELTKDEVSTLTLLVKVISNGTIENVVSVTSDENDTNLTNNEYPCENVTVLEGETPIELISYNITYGDDEIITVILPDGATGTVNITVGERTYPDVPIDNGKVILPVKDLAGGNYTVTVDYGGDGYYLPNSTSGTFNVARVVPIITIEVEDIWVGEIEVVNVTVNAPGTVNVTVYGITVTISLDNGVVTTDVLALAKESYKGNATWNLINLPVGAYPAFALYPGNENYTSVNTSDLFHVRDIPTTIVVKAGDIHVGEDAVIEIEVGPEGVTGDVEVTLDGEKYIVPLENGKAKLIVSDLPAGKKEVYVKYNGTTIYHPSENTTAFKVLKIKPPVSVDAPEITVGEDGVITVTVPDDATGTITIEIEGKRYSAPVEDGKAIFIVPGLKVGEHDIIAFYSGDDKYLPANNTGSIKVNPTKENKTHNLTPDYPYYPEGGISLAQYPTANPIFALLLVLLNIGFIPFRRLKK